MKMMITIIVTQMMQIQTKKTTLIQFKAAMVVRELEMIQIEP